MRISLKILIYLMTASLRLLSVTGNEGGRVNINYWDNNTPVEINCRIGETVQIKCTYPDSHESNDKFLCMGEEPFNCEKLIYTTDQDRDVTEGRFHIRDNKRKKYFYVDISNLSTIDSGSYWCGSSTLEDIYPQILLYVATPGLFISWEMRERVRPVAGVSSSQYETLRPHYFSENYFTTRFVAEEHIETFEPDPPPLQITTSSATSKNHFDDPLTTGMIATVVVCLALLLILVLVLILSRHKLARMQVCCAAGESSEQRTNAEHNTEGNHEAHHYEEIEMESQQASSGDALPSVYATVNHPGEQLHKAGIKFQENSFIVSTDGNALSDTNKNGSAACVDSSVSRSEGATHPPAAEQTVYSQVTITKPEEA